MSAYVSTENGRLSNGLVRRDLEKDGRVIMVGTPIETGKYVREVMQPGDTFQEVAREIRS
jgi:hypothetical protein